MAEITVHKKIFDALVIGTGAAGYNAGLHLFDKGVTNLAIVTEGRLSGTSRNAGSDKQTYYKVACAGSGGDSPRLMAETLFAGGSMDGDLALCEASQSLEEFFHLVSLGVEFPHNEYGEFAGYKTDHDPLERASSTGPYTSKHMTLALEKEVFKREIPLLDHHQVIKILTDTGTRRAYGILCIENKKSYCIYLSRNIICASGGPAGIYRQTVYPISQFGASGLLVREGVEFSNITEWQYGIGSLGFRWNLSGSYQQVIPRYIAVDSEGKEDEFLGRYFSSFEKLVSAVFLKGYQWPFDPGKINNEGSSLVDYAVYVEKHLKGKRIFLDFMHNPGSGNDIFDINRIDKTAYEYLEQSDALKPTPIERLQSMNNAAYVLYKTNGVDLAKEYVEIDVLPQHHNGGARVNIFWETSVKHLFAIGECAGTHGIKRPGGSALNSGQVGGLRAAEYIAANNQKTDNYFDNEKLISQKAMEISTAFVNSFAAKKEDTLGRIQNVNTHSASFIRTKENVVNGLHTLDELKKEAKNDFRTEEIYLLSRMLHEGILFYIENGGKSRGSYLILNSFDDKIDTPVTLTPDLRDKILCSRYDAESDSFKTCLLPVRPIPESETWFEKVWKSFREGEIFTVRP